MSIYHRLIPNQYRDSVALMHVSKRLIEERGVKNAALIMATPQNLKQLAMGGLKIEVEAKPTDLLIVIESDTEDVEPLFEFALDSLKSKHETQKAGRLDAAPLKSLVLAAREHPEANLALISVPGSYASAEALKALTAGLNVMMFSDNVPLEDEVMLKRRAHDLSLLMMGPDCGTSIINGIPLGFANRVRAGSIGIVAASGTGLQEVSTRIDALGGGISQAIGTGGRDLHEEVGGITMLDALGALEADAHTKTIILISKPAALSVMMRVISAANAANKAVIVHFLGLEAAPAGLTLAAHVQLATSLTDAAELAVAGTHATPPALDSELRAQALSLTPTQRSVRGIYTGGTFCYEAQLVFSQLGEPIASNAPIAGAQTLVPAGTHPAGHHFWDMGEDEFTRGRPHPMIDPTLRTAYLSQAAEDPSTAVILFDVVLGYGAHPDPAGALLPALTHIVRDKPHAPILVAHVCGTDADAQGRARQIEALQSAGVHIAPSNWHAAMLARAVVTARLEQGGHQ